MTRARILADYVSSGDELALKAPLASPAFTGTPTGITAAHITSGVLPVGVTGGTGLTALGTVATGNLSNDAIVYPTGHIIQTVIGSGATEVYSDTDSWTSSPLKGTVTCVITPKFSTSSIWLYATFGCYTGSNYSYFDFYKAVSGLSDTYNLSGFSQGLQVISTGSSWTNATITMIDPVSEDNVNEKTYAVAARNNSGSGNTHIGFAVTTSGYTITAMEIAV